MNRLIYDEPLLKVKKGAFFSNFCSFSFLEFLYFIILYLCSVRNYEVSNPSLQLQVNTLSSWVRDTGRRVKNPGLKTRAFIIHDME